MGLPVVRVCLNSSGREAGVWTWLGASTRDSLSLLVVSGLLLSAAAPPSLSTSFPQQSSQISYMAVQDHQEAKIETASSSYN